MMSDAYSQESTPRGIAGVIARLNGLLARIPASLPQLATRLALAFPFYFSGLTKWDGFLQISPSTGFLFANEYMLRWFNEDNPIALPAPETLGWLAAAAEIVLPILLIIGLGTRFAALGLLAMTMVIQFVYPNAWVLHSSWAAMALVLVVWGGGKLSLDHILGRVFAGGRN